MTRHAAPAAPRLGLTYRVGRHADTERPVDADVSAQDSRSLAEVMARVTGSRAASVTFERVALDGSRTLSAPTQAWSR